MVEDSDPVTIGIREWQKVKQAAEEAIGAARAAQEEAAFYRGQSELMQEQRRTDEATMRRLQQHCDEINIMVEALGAAVLGIVEKRKAGFFAVQAVKTAPNARARAKPRSISTKACAR